MLLLSFMILQNGYAKATGGMAITQTFTKRIAPGALEAGKQPRLYAAQRSSRAETFPKNALLPED
jgi:hypothetical protein